MPPKSKKTLYMCETYNLFIESVVFGFELNPNMNQDWLLAKHHSHPVNSVLVNYFKTLPTSLLCVI